MENQQQMKLKKVVSFCLTGGDIPAGKHLTLWFKPRGEERLNWVQRLGEEVLFEELFVLQDQNVICVVCELQDKTLYKGESQEHVTMETFDGAAPALSNNLILANKAMCEAVTATAFTKKAFLSAMYYSSEGKSYTTKTTDWRV